MNNRKYIWAKFKGLRPFGTPSIKPQYQTTVNKLTVVLYYDINTKQPII